MSVNINLCDETCSGCCINNQCASDMDCIVLFFSSTAMLMINLALIVCCGFVIFCKGLYDVIKILILKIIRKITKGNLSSLQNKNKDRNIQDIKHEYIITPTMA